MTTLLRFAPSPTGALHLGGLRTALFNHLYARKLGGKWILRIEDTDATRAVPGSVDGIREALNWAGLEYDYGPEKGGPHAPYFQSERLDLYHTHAKKLIESGHAYRCFCSPDRLAATRESLARVGSNATYDKACLNLTEEEVARRVRAGEKHIVRLNDSNLPHRSTPPDLIFGNVRDAHASLPTDPVLLKTDLFPTYHLASVVDDHSMGITHVLRGEEWLPSLPLHLDLYACLGLHPPEFAHLPLLLNPDGTKMSKRKGDVHVADFMKRGWEPEAVLNWLALAGWGVQHDHPASSPSGHASHGLFRSTWSAFKTAPSSTTVLTMSDMIRDFDLKALTHRRTVLDPAKLEILNKQHLARRWNTPDGLDELAGRAHGLIKDTPYTSQAYIKKVILALESRLTNLNALPAHGAFFFEDPDFTSSEARGMLKGVSSDDYQSSRQSAISTLTAVAVDDWEKVDFNLLLHEECQAAKIKSKTYMTTIRYALSGVKTGPSVPDIFRVLGRERSIHRLMSAPAFPERGV
ncbi:hypothetical protein PUNSTDRAFT_57115 [Punctularia strigosozonata HHB-11173 SS5]|uniref:uncharacterized protein n=1 Tax=Punctularia strigosozonata (strain HHB-11173) TaxID=741275 RepID=UPI0004416EF9|nr:uncharacterized protein PUNSTDRAFT_57115 [Punctularia strigosozonata HHB-11173 SS5]EIN13144.1 hypothetical protein PUNSTDRAFT_57115 [Punctularia strigosozonata HHB-11173 SS5]